MPEEIGHPTLISLIRATVPQWLYHPASADGVNDGENDSHGEQNPADVESHAAHASESECDGDKSDDE
jgi:hypothetical protein